MIFRILLLILFVEAVAIVVLIRLPRVPTTACEEARVQLGLARNAQADAELRLSHQRARLNAAGPGPHFSGIADDYERAFQDMAATVRGTDRRHYEFRAACGG